MESYVAASSAVALLGFVYRENGKREREREGRKGDVDSYGLSV